ncbi:MAG: hypothetical protein EBU49_03935 [Proteobacteria bacterium]|nr:hypothetical protein [Pseudomonadota bacterium]
MNINSTPDAFNYGLLSTSGQLGWAVGGEVVQLGKNIGEGFLLLGKSGADCVTGGYAFGSDSVFMPCLTTALVAGAIVVTVYVPAAAPYIGYAGTGLATGMAGWNAYRCVAPSNLTMEQSLEYCRKASADLATAIPVGQIAGLAKKLSKTAAARKFDAEATCVTNGYQTKRSREGNPVIGDEVLQTELRGKEIVQLQRSGSAKDVTDAANKLDDMGKFFAVTNTEQKLMPLTGGKAHEMHIALSLIRNSATTEELAFLMGGINAGKRELLTKLASKLYGPITETDEIAKNLVKNAEVYFTAAQKVKGYFYRYKQIPQGDIPTICTEMNTIQAQKIADKYMPSGFTNSTGRRMGGKGGVGMFKWEDGGDTVPVIFQINATKGGVLGVVATGESTIMQLAKLKFGDRAILNEAILMLPKPTATGVRKRVIDMPDGAGGFKPESVMIIELEYQTDSLVPKVISVVAQVGGSIKDFFDEPPPLDTCEACSEEEIPPSECGTATWTCIPDIVNPAANPPMWHATSWCATPSGKNCGSPSMENSACTHVLKGPFDDGNGVFLRWWSGDWESANKVVGDTYVAPCVEMP